MNRKLALSSLMLLVAGPAIAESSVNISGSIYAGLAYNSGFTAMGAPSSVMIKGKEDLGNRHSVIFKLEHGFYADTGAQANPASLFDKQAYIGVQGPWGTVRAGRLYTPSFATLALVADPTATYSVITATNLMETHGVRFNNGVIYNTPGFDPWTYARKGFFAAAAHFLGEKPEGGSSRDSATGFNVGYGKGPFVVEASSQRSNLYISPMQNLDFRSYLIAANYKLGTAKIHVAASDNYTRNDYLDAKTKSNRDYLIGLTWPLGPGVLMASFIQKDDRMAADNDAYQIGAIYDYPVSKRTKFTVGFVKIENSKEDIYKVINGYAGTTAATARTSSFTLGMTHNF